MSYAGAELASEMRAAFTPVAGEYFVVGRSASALDFLIHIDRKFKSTYASPSVVFLAFVVEVLNSVNIRSESIQVGDLVRHSNQVGPTATRTGFLQCAHAL